MGGKIETIWVAVVSAQAEDRVALRDLFDSSPGFQCQGAYNSAEDALKSIPGTLCHLAIMGLPGLGTTALKCLTRLKAHLSLSHLKTMVLFGPPHETAEWLRAALQAGTNGLIKKPKTPSEVLATATSVIEKGRGLSASLIRQFPAFFIPTGVLIQPDADPFCEQENAILALSGLGQGDTQIADWLHLNVETVATRWRKLFVQYKLHSRTAMVVLWLQSHISFPSGPLNKT